MAEQIEDSFVVQTDTEVFGTNVPTSCRTFLTRIKAAKAKIGSVVLGTPSVMAVASKVIKCSNLLEMESGELTQEFHKTVVVEYKYRDPVGCQWMCFFYFELV